MEDLVEKYGEPSKLTANQILEDLQDSSLSRPPRKIISSNDSREPEWTNSNNLLVYHDELIESLEKFRAAKETLSLLDAELQKRINEMKDKVSVKLTDTG